MLSIDHSQKCPPVLCDALPEALSLLPMAGKVSLNKHATDSCLVFVVAMQNEPSLKVDIYVNGDSVKSTSSEVLVPAWMCKGLANGANMVIERRKETIELPDSLFSEEPEEDDAEDGKGNAIAQAQGPFRSGVPHFFCPCLTPHPDIAISDATWELTRPIVVDAKRKQIGPKPPPLSSHFLWRAGGAAAAAAAAPTTKKEKMMLMDVQHLLK